MASASPPADSTLPFPDRPVALASSEAPNSVVAPAWRYRVHQPNPLLVTA